MRSIVFLHPSSVALTDSSPCVKRMETKPISQNPVSDCHNGWYWSFERKNQTEVCILSHFPKITWLLVIFYQTAVCKQQWLTRFHKDLILCNISTLKLYLLDFLSVKTFMITSSIVHVCLWNHVTADYFIIACNANNHL